MTAPPTRLAQASRAARDDGSRSPDQLTRLGKAIASGALAGELIELPRALGAAWIRIASHVAVQRIEGDVNTAMGSIGIELSVMTGLTYEAERAVRTLAEVVRDPDDHDRMFGTMDEWQRMDSDTIAVIWQMYGDVRERLNPLEQGLTADELATIHAACAKKNSMLLRSFGVSKLARFLISTDVLQST